MAGRQILQIDPPAVLKFKGQANAPQLVDLKLFNPTNDVVLFKIKTTAPKRYCVRPNSGSTQPGASVVVSISFQPSAIEAENDRSKHKFMVQSIIAPADLAIEGHDQLWKDTSTEKIGETRLKCVFEPTEANENGGSGAQDAVGSSAMPADLINNLNVNPGSSSLNTSANAGGANSNGSGDLASENQQLRTRISQLNDECARLRESELRLRRVGSPASEKHAPAPQATATVEKPSVNMQTLLTISLVALFIGFLIGKFVL